MAASTYLGDTILNWLRGTAFAAAPSGLYVSIHSADPGGAGTTGDVTTAVLGGRVQLLQANLGSPAASAEGGRQISNVAALTLTSSALASATLTHYGVWTASSGGSFLVSGQLTAPVAAVTGDILRFAAGQLIIPTR